MKPPKTWDEMIEVASLIKRKEKDENNEVLSFLSGYSGIIII